MALFDMRSAECRHIAKHPAIHGKRILGRGDFSRVYDDGDTVLKLTIDRKSYRYLTSKRRPIGNQFPDVREDIGIVGSIGGNKAFLVRMERLRTIGSNLAYQDLIADLEMEVCNNIDYTSGCPKDYADALRESVKIPKYSIVADSVRQIASFCVQAKAHPDIHLANVMYRQSTGDIVFTDPVMDREIHAQSY